MNKPGITNSQGRDPEYSFHSSSQELIYSMDKLMTESAENFISAGKSRLSDSSINVPQEDKISAPAPEVEADELETRLDISSELIAESIPNSASKVSVSSPSQLSDGFRLNTSHQKLCL